MKIYLLKLKLESKQIIKGNFYYSVLGSILNLFENDIEIYNSILAISPLIKEEQNYLIKLSIFGEQNFNKIVNEILKNKKELSLDGIKFKVLGLDFNFSFLDLENLDYKNFSSIVLDFKSPTFIRKKLNKKDRNFYLPEAKIFFISAIKKYLDLIGEKQNKDFFENLKQKIEKNFFVGEFNIHTKQVKIKTGIKAGVVGTIKYNLIIDGNLEENEKALIYKSLRLVNYIGLGNSTKLGLGQVRVRFF